MNSRDILGLQIDLLAVEQNHEIKRTKAAIKSCGYLWRYKASSRAHLRLDSWWPKPAQVSQCFPGQSILVPQYKYFSWPVFWRLNFTTFSLEIENGDEDRNVEMREENRKNKAIAVIPRASRRIGDLGFGLGFEVTWIAIPSHRNSKKKRYGVVRSRVKYKYKIQISKKKKGSMIDVSLNYTLGWLADLVLYSGGHKRSFFRFPQNSSKYITEKVKTTII